MNEIKKIRIVIEAYEWEPMRKKALADLDELLAKLRTKELLTHYGDVHTVYTEENANGR